MRTIGTAAGTVATAAAAAAAAVVAAAAAVLRHSNPLPYGKRHWYLQAHPVPCRRPHVISYSMSRYNRPKYDCRCCYSLFPALSNTGSGPVGRCR